MWGIAPRARAERGWAVSHDRVRFASSLPVCMDPVRVSLLDASRIGGREEAGSRYMGTLHSMAVQGSAFCLDPADVGDQSEDLLLVEFVGKRRHLITSESDGFYEMFVGLSDRMGCGV